MRKYSTEDVKRFVLVAGRGYIAAELRLNYLERREVTVT